MNFSILINGLLAWLLITVKTFGQMQLKCPYDKWNQQNLNSLHRKSFAKRDLQEINDRIFLTDHNNLMDILRDINISNRAQNSLNLRKQKEKPNEKPREQHNFITSPNCNSSMTLYYRTYDGSCNNRLHPQNGRAKLSYARLLPANYDDGLQEPARSITGNALPNARLLSLTIYGEKTIPDDFRTLMLMQWSQMVAHDLSKFTTEGAPNDCCNRRSFHPLCNPIMLDPLDPMALAKETICLHFVRSRFNSAGEKITVTSSYLDLGIIYGDSIEQNKKVRLFKRGLLKMDSHRGFIPIIPNSNNECPSGNEHCFMMPDNRDQITPLAIVLHIILVREHNRLAKRLFKLNTHYTDERLFQEARKINIAQYQKITYYDWLPLVLGRQYAHSIGLIYSTNPLKLFINDYVVHLNAAPYAEFSAAAFRYGHHQIPGLFSLISADRQLNQTIRMSTYFNVQRSVDLLNGTNNFDYLLRGLVTQLQKLSDDNVDKEIKHCFGRRLNTEFGTDLRALDIQRGRDFGLRSYNDYREFCGLPRATDWSDLSKEIPLNKIAKMRKVYASPHDVDLSIGGSLETHAPGAIFGPTFQCIIGKEFLKVRQSDRFFFERNNIFSGFNQNQLAEIRKVSLAGLLCVNGNNLKRMQSDAFILPHKRNSLTDCKNFHQLNLEHWMDRGFFDI